VAAGLLLRQPDGVARSGRASSAEEANVSAAHEYRYNRLTWPEMNEAIAAQKLVILPTGSTEQHGRHLPLDVDVFLCESVCLEVGRRACDRVLVLPPIS
jgi:creatinine amidohydrolase